MAGPLNWLSQIVSITRLCMQTIPRRKGSSLAAIFGIAGVVAVLVGVLSIAAGIQHTMQTSGQDDVAIIMRSGATGEMMSGLGGQETKDIADTEGIARSAERTLASAELFVIINLPKRSTGTDANVPLRGVSPAAFDIRRFELLEGRRFEWGRNEVIVGRGAAAEFTGLDLNAELQVGKNTWKVVGIFGEQGGISESEIWTDAAVLQPAYRRGNSYQSVYARLTSADEFQAFKDRLTTDPRLNVKVQRLSDYYAEESTLLITIITVLGVLIASLMALGAVFGALNTMYSAVAARTREIATLRALGFGALPVIISVLLESLLLAAVGGFLGGGAAYLAFDGFRAATINWTSFSQVTFAFAVTPPLLILGTIYAIAIGLVGGLLPAWRAARLPVATALREL